MSNLKLPTMTHAKIMEFMDGDWKKKLAYETVAERWGAPHQPRIEIRYFETVIATLWLNGDIRVTTGGYDTATTLRRIAVILNDNNTKVAVSTKQFEVYWSIRNTKVLKPFHTLTILHDGTIIDPNEEVNR